MCKKTGLSLAYKILIMKILVVSATIYEIGPFLEFLEKECSKKSFFEYEYNGHIISPIVCGIGALNMAFSIARFTGIKEIGYIINPGIAGTFSEKLALGSVVEVISDRFADLGIEEKNGDFKDVFDLELEDKNKFPFINGCIHNEKRKYDTGLPKVQAITVNKVHGEENSILRIKQKYNVDIESMEGAGFFYACKIMDLSFSQIRSISNRVEPRNRESWKVEEAIDRLNEELIKHIKTVLS